MNPCVDYCFQRFGRQYTPECDAHCAYAKKVQNNSGRDGSKKTYRQISYTDRRSLDKRTVR